MIHLFQRITAGLFVFFMYILLFLLFISFSSSSCCFSVFIWNKPYLSSGYHSSKIRSSSSLKHSELSSFFPFQNVTVSGILHSQAIWTWVTPSRDSHDLKRLQIHSQEAWWLHITATCGWKGDTIVCFRSFQAVSYLVASSDFFVALITAFDIMPSKVQRSNHHRCRT